MQHRTWNAYHFPIPVIRLPPWNNLCVRQPVCAQKITYTSWDWRAPNYWPNPTRSQFPIVSHMASKGYSPEAEVRRSTVMADNFLFCCLIMRTCTIWAYPSYLWPCTSRWQATECNNFVHCFRAGDLQSWGEIRGIWSQPQWKVHHSVLST